MIYKLKIQNSLLTFVENAAHILFYIFKSNIFIIFLGMAERVSETESRSKDRLLF